MDVAGAAVAVGPGADTVGCVVGAATVGVAAGAEVGSGSSVGACGVWAAVAMTDVGVPGTDVGTACDSFPPQASAPSANRTNAALPSVRDSQR